MAAKEIPTNIYGDKLTPDKKIGEGHTGLDISTQRTDDLDKQMLAHIAAKSQARILELGPGAAGQTFRMVEAGAIVTAVDIVDLSETFHLIRKENSVDSSNMEFIKGDISQLPQLLGGRKFTDGFSQRTLHYLPYAEALKVLSYLRQIITDRLYLSVTGLETQIGDGYPDKEKPVIQRWATIAPSMAELHSIKAPVCLYTENELTGLAEKAGWSTVNCWTSRFGNIKAIFSHPTP